MAIVDPQREGCGRERSAVVVPTRHRVEITRYAGCRLRLMET